MQLRACAAVLRLRVARRWAVPTPGSRLSCTPSVMLNTRGATLQLARRHGARRARRASWGHASQRARRDAKPARPQGALPPGPPEPGLPAPNPGETCGTDKHMTPAPLHGRRSPSNLRRPPQEVAASCPYGGVRTPTRSGATVGEPRPSARNPAPFPGGEGVTAVAVTDRGSPACTASRRALCAPCPPALFQSPRMRVQRAEGSLARVWGEKPQRPPFTDTRKCGDKRA